MIADEINRSSPKTQSALLEAMEEGQVTVDGRTHLLPSRSSVVATQNPLEMEGTYALPEAQRDRFMMRISMGYPDARSEALMLRQRDTVNPLDALGAVASAERVAELIACGPRASRRARRSRTTPSPSRRRTRTHSDLRLGREPARDAPARARREGWAALDGRGFVIPDDIDALVARRSAHRLIPTRGAASVEDVVDRIVAETPVPAGAVQPS